MPSLKKLQRIIRRGDVGRVLVHEDEGRRGHRPGRVARLVGQDEVETRRMRPVGVGCRGLEGILRRSDRLAGLVDHVGVGQLILYGIGVFDIADRALGAGTLLATPSLPLPPIPPGHSTVVATPTLASIRAHLAEIVGEVEGRARAVGAMDGGDRQVGQVELGIELLDRRVVPLGDLAEIDVGERRAVENESRPA